MDGVEHVRPHRGLTEGVAAGLVEAVLGKGVPRGKEGHEGGVASHLQLLGRKALLGGVHLAH